MKIEIWPAHGPLNSKPIFEKFISSLRNAGEDVYVNRDANADVAVIWSVLWQGRMQSNRRIWEKYRNEQKPVIVLEVGGLRRNESWKIGINGINRDADFANQVFDDKRLAVIAFLHVAKTNKRVGTVQHSIPVQQVSGVWSKSTQT